MKYNIFKVWNGIKELAFGIYKMPLYKKIGYLFLIPPLIGVYQYLSFADLFDISKDSWEGIWKGDVELHFKRPRDYLRGASSLDGIASLNSTIPIFLGLMAIASAYLIKDRK